MVDPSANSPWSIHVLGRTVPISKVIDGRAVPCINVLEVHEILQSQLNMPSRVFEISDSGGAPITTDAELQEALRAARVPFTALLAGTSSVHFLEAKQEALAQMQAKMLSGHEPQSARKDSAEESLLGSNPPENDINEAVRELLKEVVREESQQLYLRVAACEAADDQVGSLVFSLQEAIASYRATQNILVSQVDNVIIGLETESLQRTTAANCQQDEVQRLSIRVDHLYGALPSNKQQFEGEAPMEHTFTFSGGKGASAASTSESSMETSARFVAIDQQIELMQRQMLDHQEEMGAAMNKCAEESSQALLQQLRVLQQDLVQYKDLNSLGMDELRINCDQVLSGANHEFAIFKESCASLSNKCLGQQSHLDAALQSFREMMQGVAGSVEDVLVGGKNSPEEFSILQKIKIIEQNCVSAEEKMRHIAEKDCQQRESEMKNWREALLGNVTGDKRGTSKDRSSSKERRDMRSPSANGRSSPSFLLRSSEQHSSGPIRNAGGSLSVGNYKALGTPNVQLLWNEEPASLIISDAGSDQTAPALGPSVFAFQSPSMGSPRVKPPPMTPRDAQRSPGTRSPSVPNNSRTLLDSGTRGNASKGNGGSSSVPVVGHTATLSASLGLSIREQRHAEGNISPRMWAPSGLTHKEEEAEMSPQVYMWAPTGPLLSEVPRPLSSPQQMQIYEPTAIMQQAAEVLIYAGGRDGNVSKLPGGSFAAPVASFAPPAIASFAPPAAPERGRQGGSFSAPGAHQVGGSFAVSVGQQGGGSVVTSAGPDHLVATQLVGSLAAQTGPDFVGTGAWDGGSNMVWDGVPPLVSQIALPLRQNIVGPAFPSGAVRHSSPPVVRQDVPSPNVRATLPSRLNMRYTGAGSLPAASPMVPRENAVVANNPMLPFEKVHVRQDSVDRKQMRF